ncbi:MAG: hypothetical protein PHE88_09995 [Elusimicrobia bacterium]|nr:hypothetical protein [Elusimicrobiota bacterium]
MITKMVNEKLHSGLKIPGTTFIVKGCGKRRGKCALIYLIPNNNNPNKPYEKGITKPEWQQAYQQIKTNKIFTRQWFNKNMKLCVKEGGCNFKFIGHVFVFLKKANYKNHGVFSKRGKY